MDGGEVPVRLWRSVLAVPGVRPELFPKAAAGDADRVFLDLEDSVAPDDKERARAAVIRGSGRSSGRDDGGSVSVRINGIDTHWMYRDLIDVVEQAGDRLDSVVLPKAAVAADIHLVDALLGQIERATGIARRIGIEPIIETALGLSNVESIAAAGPRLRALHFGPGDMAASLGVRTTAIGGLDPGYPGDQWHAVLSRIVTAARAHGLAPVAGPFGDLADADGFAASARRAAVLGCAGVMVVHPSQIGPANAAFTPTPAEVEHARRVLAALDEAAAGGPRRRPARRAPHRRGLGAPGGRRGGDGRGHRAPVIAGARAVVTRRLPEPVEERLAGLVDARLNPDDRPLTAGELAEAMRGADALVATVTDRLTADLLSATPRRVGIVANFGAGVNHIDLDAARRAGIVVTNTPGVLTDATADLTMALLLAVARRTGEGERCVRSGAWTGWGPTQMLGRSVTGMTLGIVGMGRIGRAVAHRATRGFGMRVLYHQRGPWTRPRSPAWTSSAPATSTICWPGATRSRCTPRRRRRPGT